MESFSFGTPNLKYRQTSFAKPGDLDGGSRADWSADGSIEVSLNTSVKGSPLVPGTTKLDKIRQAMPRFSTDGQQDSSREKLNRRRSSGDDDDDDDDSGQPLQLLDKNAPTAAEVFDSSDDEHSPKKLQELRRALRKNVGQSEKKMDRDEGSSVASPRDEEAQESGRGEGRRRMSSVERHEAQRTLAEEAEEREKHQRFALAVIHGKKKTVELDADYLLQKQQAGVVPGVKKKVDPSASGTDESGGALGGRNRSGSMPLSKPPSSRSGRDMSGNGPAGKGSKVPGVDDQEEGYQHIAAGGRRYLKLDWTQLDSRARALDAEDPVLVAKKRKKAALASIYGDVDADFDDSMLNDDGSPKTRRQVEEEEEAIKNRKRNILMQIDGSLELVGLTVVTDVRKLKGGEDNNWEMKEVEKRAKAREKRKMLKQSLGRLAKGTNKAGSLGNLTGRGGAGSGGAGGSLAPLLQTSPIGIGSLASNPQEEDEESDIEDVSMGDDFEIVASEGSQEDGIPSIGRSPVSPTSQSGTASFGSGGKRAGSDGSLRRDHRRFSVIMRNNKIPLGLVMAASRPPPRYNPKDYAGQTVKIKLKGDKELLVRDYTELVQKELLSNTSMQSPLILHSERPRGPVGYFATVRAKSGVGTVPPTKEEEEALLRTRVPRGAEGLHKAIRQLSPHRGRPSGSRGGEPRNPLAGSRPAGGGKRKKSAVAPQQSRRRTSEEPSRDNATSSRQSDRRGDDDGGSRPSSRTRLGAHLLPTISNNERRGSGGGNTQQQQPAVHQEFYDGKQNVKRLAAVQRLIAGNIPQEVYPTANEVAQLMASTALVPESAASTSMREQPESRQSREGPRGRVRSESETRSSQRSSKTVTTGADGSRRGSSEMPQGTRRSLLPALK